MVKIVIFFKHKSGISTAAFHKHWRTVHADLILKLPGLRGYVQSHALRANEHTAEPLFDAVAESWFDDTQAMRELAKTTQYAAVLADEPNFIDRRSMGSIITEERVIKEGPVPAAAIKRIDFLNRRAGMSVEAFQSRWIEVYGPRYASLPAVRRYVQSYTRSSAYEGGRTPAYDGAAMTWFDSVAEVQAFDTSPEFARLREDMATFVEKVPPSSVLAREYVVMAAGG